MLTSFDGARNAWGTPYTGFEVPRCGQFRCCADLGVRRRRVNSAVEARDEPTSRSSPTGVRGLAPADEAVEKRHPRGGVEGAPGHTERVHVGGTSDHARADAAPRASRSRPTASALRRLNGPERANALRTPFFKPPSRRSGASSIVTMRAWS